MGEENSHETTKAVDTDMIGTVTDQDGEALPGVVIKAVHQPTGTTYSTITFADGNWRIANMRAGGPYSVTASMDGFNTVTKNNIYLKLGEDKTIDFELSLASTEESA